MAFNPDESEARKMEMTREQFKDECWTEIRQLVLNDGPVTESLDRQLAAVAAELGEEISPETREAMIAELLCFLCAKILGATEGPLEGAPLSIIIGAVAGTAFEMEMGR